MVTENNMAVAANQKRSKTDICHFGETTAWLGSGKHCGLGLNNSLTYTTVVQIIT